jgi:two-component system nitrate/nitrite response regulator NarL
VLIDGGFSLGQQESDNYNDTIVVIDANDCNNPEIIGTYQSRGVMIVALTSEADCREMGPEEIEPLSGVLTYDLSADAFMRSLRLISAGERVFPHNLALGRKNPAPPRGGEHRAGIRLSPREKEVLSRLVEGHSNKMIARHLGMTEATAKVHLKSLLRKIGVENRTQAAIWALSNLPDLNPA